MKFLSYIILLKIFEKIIIDFHEDFEVELFDKSYLIKPKHKLSNSYINP